MSEVIVRADRRVAIKPFLVGLLISLVVLIGGFLLRTVDAMAMSALGVVAIFVLLVGSVRAVIWLHLAGRCTLSIGDGIVALRSRRRYIEFPVGDVGSVRILEGNPWPEWSRWATLPRIVIEPIRGDRVSARILLSDKAIKALNSKLEGLFSS